MKKDRKETVCKQIAAGGREHMLKENHSSRQSIGV